MNRRASSPLGPTWASWGALGLGVMLAVSGCSKGGSTSGPTGPSAIDHEVPAGTAGQGTGDAGYQFAVDESAAEGTGPRPEMSARAKEAYQAGLRAFSVGDLNGARTQFLAAIAADGKAYQAHYSLGVVEERLGSPAAAAAAYRKALDVVPDYEQAAAAQALLMAKRGDHESAARDLRARLSRLPKSAILTGALAEVRSMQGESGEAQRLAQEALKKNPDYRPAMVTLARDHYRRRRLDLALYTLQGILDGYGPENPPRDKNNAEARLLRGLIYRERNQRGLAIDELTRAVELRPDLVEARLQLATYMLEAGNSQGALPHLEAAVRYDHKNVLARLNLGDAYRLAERPADARRELEWVAKAAPERVEVHYNLGLLFLLSKSIPGMTPIQATNKAIEHLEAYRERGVRGGPDDTEELITRAKTRKALLEAEAQEAKGARDTAAEPPTEEAP